jgi:exodeoxyribonuclease VII small subunit
MAKKTDAVKKLTYEQALAELEQIVNALENDSQGLEGTLRQFERGKTLLQHCQKLLQGAELKVRQLTEEGFRDFDGK